jgi:predicted transcriptional regulator
MVVSTNTFRNKNIVAKEKRSAKSKKLLLKLGIDGPPMSKDEERLAKRRARAKQLADALRMIKEGRKLTDIAKELNVDPQTISNWKKKHKVEVQPEIPETQPDPDAFRAKLSNEAKAAVEVAKEIAQQLEDKEITDMAEKQCSPQEQYQAYVAAQGIRILRDSMGNIRPPRTVKELGELDAIIRRSMGLSNNGSGGGAGSSLTIDVNILNNVKATKGGANSVVYEAEVTDD